MFRLLRKIKFIFIFVCFILFVGGVAVFGNSHFNKKVKEVPSSTEVNNSTNENTTNILLLGEDTNSMMIASVDEEKKNISITPVENVSYVDNSTKETLLNSIEKKTKVNLDKFIHSITQLCIILCKYNSCCIICKWFQNFDFKILI